ncbi:hypothetical protein LJR164_002665 [Phenylobacterium sp. LjRoot164]|uniref:hypothetical protein n=1 Tax=unclassified Phenylobacterium TaxID=2640670 RepID=UPI003ECD9032
MTKIEGLTEVKSFKSDDEFRQLEAWINARLGHGEGLADVTSERPPRASVSARYILHVFGNEVWELTPPQFGEGGRFIAVAHYFDWHDAEWDAANV